MPSRATCIFNGRLPEANRMKKVVVIGEVLVEIMADGIGDGFLEAIGLTGPFPSGAPAIFIDQVARLNQPCGIVSAVGDDDFGKINLNRLSMDGVDISGISIDPDRPTGSAFVRYQMDGSRDFVYNIKHSACGKIPRTPEVAKVLGTADHLHIMGSSLSSPEFVALNLETACKVKANGGTISFDPNLRKEILNTPGLRDAMANVLSLTDVFLPSGEELTLLTDAGDPAIAAKELLALGLQYVVHKMGSGGVRIYDTSGTRFFPAYSVTEIDPTGAGDCFGGAFIALWLQGLDIDKVVSLASAAGACAVQHRGPMEGALRLETLDRFVKEYEDQQNIVGGTR